MNGNDIKHTIDAGAVVTTIGAIVGWFPAIASGLTIIWLAIRIYESDTVQRRLRKK